MSAKATPAKGGRVLSSQLELSPTSPLIDGLRQSTIAFKAQRTMTRAKPIATINENIKPTLNGAELKIDASATEEKSKLHKGRGSARVLKQSLLTENSTVTTQETANNLQKVAKSTRSRRTNTRRSVSASDTNSVRGEQPQLREPKTCSLSPRKQLCACPPVPQSNALTSRLQQTKLSNFGIRRTARQFAKDVQQQKEAEVISAVIRSEESGMKVVVTEEKGRGVISTRTFYPGEFVVEYIGELIFESEARVREAEYKKDPNVGSFMFFFSHGGLRYCVDATKETDKLGRLINHSRLHPNCTVKVLSIEGIPRLVLLAKTEIPPGEELLYDYGDRGKESLIAHPWLKT